MPDIVFESFIVGSIHDFVWQSTECLWSGI